MSEQRYATEGGWDWDDGLVVEESNMGIVTVPTHLDKSEGWARSRMACSSR